MVGGVLVELGGSVIIDSNAGTERAVKRGAGGASMITGARRIGRSNITMPNVVV